MLKLRFKNNKHNAVWLVEPKVTIGSAVGNDLVVEAPGVAPQHAEILVKHEKLTLVNKAGQGLAVNNRSVTDSAALDVNDVLAFGETELQVIDPKSEPRAAAPAEDEKTGWALKANHAALANRVFPVKAATIVGRSNECDITLAAAHLSRRHAKLVVENGLLYVRDLGSANGTYLNGEKINEARVRRGDELRFDTLRFGVIGPSSEDLDKTSVRPMSAIKVKPDAAKPAQPATRAARSTHAQRPAAADPGRGSQTSEPSPVATGNDAAGGKGKIVWALGLVVAIALAAGLAWQQGFFTP